MVDRVIQAEVAQKPGEPGLWIAFYPVLGQMRRTLFADLDGVKDAVRHAVQAAHKGQSLECHFMEVPFASLPFEENRPDFSEDADAVRRDYEGLRAAYFRQEAERDLIARVDVPADDARHVDQQDEDAQRRYWEADRELAALGVERDKVMGRVRETEHRLH